MSWGKTERSMGHPNGVGKGEGTISGQPTVVLESARWGSNFKREAVHLG